MGSIRDAYRKMLWHYIMHTALHCTLFLSCTSGTVTYAGTVTLAKPHACDESCLKGVPQHTLLPGHNFCCQIQAVAFFDCQAASAAACLRPLDGYGSPHKLSKHGADASQCAGLAWTVDGYKQWVLR